MKQKTQKEKIVSWLTRHGSITPMDAMLHLNIYRLAARIQELRGELGRDAIETVYVLGRAGRFARYVWRGEPSQEPWVYHGEDV